jgi:hypothetical protein
VGMLRPLAVSDISRPPLVQRDDSLVHRFRGAGLPTGALCAGFLVSATTLFALASFVGMAIGTYLLPEKVRLAAALVCVVALIVLDVLALRRRAMCPITLRRQTPKNFAFHYGNTRGALIWGLDTGLAVTTFRISAATWAMIVLGLLNVAPWWQGLAYGLGFCLPIAAAILLVPRRPDDQDGTSREPHWISRMLNQHRRVAQLVTLLTAVAGLVAVAQAAALAP